MTDDRLGAAMGSTRIASLSDSAEQRVLAASFRPTAGGFIYRAPSGWRLWTKPHFLVDAELRERLIAAADESQLAVALWVAVPWIAVNFAGAAALAFWFEGGEGNELELFAAGIVIAVVGLAVGLAALAEHKWRRVAPLLSGARLTEERISSRALMTAAYAAGGPSRRTLLAQVVSGAALMAVGALNFGIATADFNRPGRAVGLRLLCWGFVAICGFAVLFAAGRKLANKTD
jgi:hypothetical protein